MADWTVIRNIKRLRKVWGVLQDRLTSELRLAQASDIGSANRVLARFVGDYNHRFARWPREAATTWRPIAENLGRICCFTHERIVGNRKVVPWDGQRLQVHPQARRPGFAGGKVQLCRALDGRVSLYRATRGSSTPISQGVTFLRCR